MAKISKANELQAMKEAREKESNKSSNNTIAIAEPLKKVEQPAEIIQEDSVKSSSNEEVLEVETVFEEPDTVDNIDVLEDALAVQEEIIAVDENELVETTLEENNEFIEEIEIMKSIHQEEN